MRHAALVLLLAGCGAGASERPPTTLGQADIERWENDREPAEDRRGAPARTLRTESFETVRLERPAPRLPTGGRRIDVRLERARLASAFRLLAEAARYGIVIGEGLDDVISVDLRRVRPLEAMRVLAVTYEVELSVVGHTIVARRAGR